MDEQIEQFYREIFSDLTLDREEAEELIEKFEEFNPPPDKLVWLRATAFRIGCEFLSDDNDSNVALLRTINAIVHALEKTRMVPKELENTDNYDDDKVTEFYQSIFSDLSIDPEENSELATFFTETCPPPIDKLISLRASAFRVGTEFLSADDNDTNVKLLKCINVVVHQFEINCLQPKPFALNIAAAVSKPISDMTVESIGLDASIQEAVQHIWDLDINRLKANVDYKINVQDSKKPYQKHDAASEPLFDFVDERYALQRPTYRAFAALLDNYSAQVGEAEVVTDSERREIWTFLRAIMQTAPMQFCHKYCHANKPDDVPSDEGGFLKLLHKIWFELYNRQRGGRPDSSGFEHVFVGEVKDDKITGFHNWIQFYLEEKKGEIDYRGYIKPRSNNGEYVADSNSDDNVLSLQFSWNGVEKFVGTSFIGVSPEFEIAVYTTCFLVGSEDNHVTLDTGTGDVFDLNIKCYSMARDKIGTSFPEALSHYEE